MLFQYRITSEIRCEYNHKATHNIILKQNFRILVASQLLTSLQSFASSTRLLNLWRRSMRRIENISLTFNSHDVRSLFFRPRESLR